MSKIVIGIDGGGTTTRVITSDLEGNVLSYVEKGASSLKKDLNAQENVQQAIIEAVKLTGSDISNVVGLVAGIAGFDSDEDLSWVESLTEVQGLSCNKIHVNDALVAHASVFLTKPGIMVISGTGSNIFAITDQGEQITNYDLCHYAYSAARFLSYETVFQLLAGFADASDKKLIADVLNHWEVRSLKELQAIARHGFIDDRRERDRKFGEMCPIVTKAAMEGSAIGRSISDKAITEIIVGINLVGAYFMDESIPVAFTGSVANSPYFKQNLKTLVNTKGNKNYKIINPVLPTVCGALLMALEQQGVQLDEKIIANLSRYSKTMI